MSNLAEKICVACSGDATMLNREEAENYLKQTPGWQLNNDATWVTRDFKFKNFKTTLAFVNQVGEIAEKHKHHPDITFTWGKCHIAIQTHAIGGLHENDFILAADINTLMDE